MRGLGLALLATAVLAAIPVFAQQQKKSTASPFDGKYAGTMNCSGGSNARFNGLTIRQGKFNLTHKTTRGAGSHSCSLVIQSDGSFENRDCDVPTTGRATADKVDFTFRSPESICEVHLTRDKS